MMDHLQITRLLSHYRNDLTSHQMDVVAKYAQSLRPNDHEGVVQLMLLIQTLTTPYTARDLSDRMCALRPHLVSQ